MDVVKVLVQNCDQKNEILGSLHANSCYFEHFRDDLIKLISVGKTCVCV